MDKTILITGATSGIGQAAAEELAARGWHVLGVGRNEERCRQSEAQIRQYVPQALLTWFTADLSSMKEVNQLADKVIGYLSRSSEGCLDIVLNNAAVVRNWYTSTEDGYEMQFAVNHLAGYLLTRRLLPFLEKSPIARVLTVSSASHRGARMRWHDLMNRKRYNCLRAYKQSKLSNVLFTAELNRRMKDTIISAFAVDPGLVDTAIGSKNTSGLVAWFWIKRRRHGISPFQAAATIVWLSKMPAGWQSTGYYYHNCKPIQPSRAARSEDNGRRLWVLSEQLSGLTTNV